MTERARATTAAFIEWLNGRPTTQNAIREYLLQFKNQPSTYANHLKSIKVFYRDFMKQPALVQSFKFPRFPFKPRIVPSKDTLREFYVNLERTKDRALFLFYATSGLRRREALG
jgi:integrase